MTNRFPDTLVLIFSLIMLAQLASYVLPPGEFTRTVVDNEGTVDQTYQPCDAGAEPPRTARVVPGTYQRCTGVEALPWHAVLTAIPKTLEGSAGIIFFVLIIGGVVRLVRATGAIDALIHWAVDRLESRPSWLVGGMTWLFAFGASTYGMSEEMVIFAPLMVTACIAMRLDAVVAVGILAVGYACGYACAAINPFSVHIAQVIAGVTPLSGQLVRWLLLVVFVAVGVHHILRYATRVAADRRASLVADIDYSTGFELKSGMRFTGRLAAVLLLFLGGILVFVHGAFNYHWYLRELSAVFLGVGIMVAVVGQIGLNRTARTFVEGAGDMIGVALMIGFARTIETVLDDARVLDTVVYGLSEPLSALPAHAAALGMLFAQTVFNLFVPSGSGQASVAMPIMAPLSDIVGVTRQTAVLAYQFGDGLTNMVIPTNAILMGLLAIGRIPYERWVRFIVPLLLKLYVLGGVALLAAVQFGF